MINEELLLKAKEEAKSKSNESGHEYVVIKINKEKMNKTPAGTWGVVNDLNGDPLYEDFYDVVPKSAIRPKGLFPVQIIN